MASLAEMMDYAKAQQPRNGLAELASHFLEGAGQGYDAGHAEAQKNQENPLVTIDPAIAASVGLPAGQKARLDVYSKLVDAHAKLTEANASLTLKKEQDALDAQSTADANKAHMTGRAASLGDIGTNALAAGQENTSGGTVMSRLDQVVKDANAPATPPTPTAGSPLEKKVTYSQSGGKVSKSTVYEPPTAPKALNPDQYAAVVSGKPADLAKAFPQGVSPDIAKMMSERQAREQAAHERMQQAQDAKDQANTQKRLLSMGDALDPSKQRQGAFGVSKQIFDRAERLQSLGQAFKDGNQLRDAEIEELAIGLNAQLSGANTGAQEQVKGLIPHTIVGNIQKTKQWLLNEPQGMNQRAFVDRMMASIDREKQTAATQIKRTQMQRVARYADLEKKSPDEFYNQLQSAGLDPAEYRAWVDGGMKPISAVQSGAPAGGGNAAPTVTSQAQYDALPSGADYLSSDGVPHRKK